MENFDSKIHPYGFYYCPFFLVGRVGDPARDRDPPHLISREQFGRAVRRPDFQRGYSHACRRERFKFF
jgi:hypothetical protein